LAALTLKRFAEARQCFDVRAQRSAVLRVSPDARGVAVVLVDDVRREIVHASGHRPWEAVDRWFLAEDRLEVGCGDRAGVERAQALLQRERPGEGLLNGDL
jgi:hypothetical protein